MYTDLLTRIKNAQQARKDMVRVPFSKMDLAVAETLVRNGFVVSAEKKGRLPKRVIEIALKYDNEGNGAVSGTKFLSKPSRRMYAKYDELYPVRQGYGIGVISTSNGIMTTKEARTAKVGGQLLFEIW